MPGVSSAPKESWSIAARRRRFGGSRRRYGRILVRDELRAIRDSRHRCFEAFRRRSARIAAVSASSGFLIVGGFRLWTKQT